MFLRIDDWLFDRVFQPFVDWFCDRTGQGPMWLACTCGYLICVVTVMKILLLPQGPYTIIDIAFCIWTFLFFRKLEKRDVSVKAGMMNARRHGANNRAARKMVVFMILITLLFVTIDSLYSVMFGQCLAFLASLYFGACEQKPPAPPKKKLQTKLARATS